MSTLEFYFSIFIVLVFISICIFLWIYIIKLSKKKMNNSVLFGLKRARVKSKVLETTVSHRLQVSRKKYEVVYRLETEEGTIAFKIPYKNVIILKETSIF
jgi:uncharacterized protein YpmB